MTKQSEDHRHNAEIRTVANAREYRPRMNNKGPGEDPDTKDAQVVMPTGIRDQRMVVSGWLRVMPTPAHGVRMCT